MTEAAGLLGRKGDGVVFFDEGIDFIAPLVQQCDRRMLTERGGGKEYERYEYRYGPTDAHCISLLYPDGRRGGSELLVTQGNGIDYQDNKSQTDQQG
jgi:hypothetical protein